MPPPPQAGYRQEELFSGNFFPNFWSKKICDVSGCKIFWKKKKNSGIFGKFFWKFFGKLHRLTSQIFWPKIFFGKFFFFCTHFLHRGDVGKIFWTQNFDHFFEIFDPPEHVSGCNLRLGHTNLLHILGSSFRNFDNVLRWKNAKKNFRGGFAEIRWKFSRIFFAILLDRIFCQKWPKKYRF